MADPDQPRMIRFAWFEVDKQTGDLRKNNLRFAQTASGSCHSTVCCTALVRPLSLSLYARNNHLDCGRIQ